MELDFYYEKDKKERESFVIYHLRDRLLYGRKILFERTICGFIDPLEVESYLNKLYREVCSDILKFCIIEAREEGFPEEDICIAAVGGFGRCEMAPYSDIDLVFLSQNEEGPFLDNVLKRGYRLLSDIFFGIDLEVGYSFRTTEIKHIDHITRTSFLDSNIISGDNNIFQEFKRNFWNRLNLTEFIFAKLSEREIASQKFGDNPYLLSPNLKECKGGLRDYHTFKWIFQSRFALPNCSIIKDVEDTNILDKNDIDKLESSYRFLRKIRILLHIMARKRQDYLSKNYQSRLAEFLGYKNSVEFMKELIYCLENISEISNRGIKKILQEGFQISSCFSIKGNNITYQYDSPIQIFRFDFIRAFEYKSLYDLELSINLEEELIKQRSKLRPNDETMNVFLKILKNGKNKASILRKMQYLGLFEILIPESRGIFYTLPEDPMHEFTIGEHTMVMIETLEMFERGDFGQEIAEIFNSLSDPLTLYLAALFHDIAKLKNSENHDIEGAKIFSNWAKKTKLDKNTINNVNFIIANHLQMVRTSRLRDLHREETIEEFAQLVSDTERLKNLYLISYADLYSLSKKKPSPISIYQLNELFKKSQSNLLKPISKTNFKDVFKRNIKKSLPNKDEINLYIDNMPATYLMNIPQDIIAFHLDLISRLKNETPQVYFEESINKDFSKVTIATYEIEGLLWKIAAVFYGHNLDIHTAELYKFSTEPPVVINEIWTTFKNRPVPEFLAQSIKKDLSDTLSLKKDIFELLREKNKDIEFPVKLFNVNCLNNISPKSTVIEIIAEDRHGLLYRLTQTLSSLGLYIQTAKISTWEGRAEDAFYITKENNLKLSDQECQEYLKKIIYHI
ncbi:UTP-GlnB uridylyltransferase, GlnD [Thermodesulfobium narugense DSM 14796]|uniref:Bifunctional uridylyltransferase/uridylyl-removing enzyme n=1 Tax=Thermodesulfobium narugense DSM 14796 TaxID=747365 RepID=M1E5R1_9BACT|nr:HD domain-containing protein [Thermodesulfobium narugense]AEE15232.1 UTP-GlnB uridylyltransferase, GlnD [Thermodesulfobium narugense DSM 14796]